MLFTLFISIILSAFFSGVEIAYVSANKLQLELKKQQGGLHAKIIEWLQQNPPMFIGAMLIGNNICLVVYGIVTAEILEPVFNQFIPSPFLVFLLQIILSTILILIAGEFIPKMISKNNANTIMEYASPLIAVFYAVLLIPAYIMTAFSNLLIRFTPNSTPNDRTETTFGMVDLDHYLQEQTHNKRNDQIEHEVQIFKNALDFSSVKARECMVPRTDIVALDVDEPLEALKQLFMETKHSKILVYRDNIDNIIGYVHHSELFKSPKTIKSMLLPIFVVPESMFANDILSLFISKQKSVAIVVDELGGTSGMLTLEDVVEEIIGDIEDEHDHEEFIEEQLGAHKYLFSARLEIDYLNETYHLGLPEFEGVETIGGAIIQTLESIPQEGQVVRLDPFEFEVKKVNQNRIELIVLTKHV